ncbi:MAG TPA: DNA polymerase III subunit beta [Gammaproteobacteria bacterium]|nr:DNA polymerase III subunit beta [Gammaproteobacteria bacterium]
MKFITEKNEIVDALQMGASIAERRQTIPILANLKIVAMDGKIEITATDLEIQLKTVTVVKEVIEEGETTVSARKMSELCRSLPDKESLEFNLNNGKLTVSSKNFHADFATLSTLDFPELESKEETDSLSIESKTLKRLLNKTAFCMASQDVRYYLNGLLVEYKEGSINTVATDGHRLAFATSQLKETAQTAEVEGKRQIIPRKAVLELAKILREENDNINLSFGNSSLRIEDINLDFSTKLIDGKFPDYEMVLPSGEPDALEISKENLQSALTRASILSNEKYRGVRFELSNNKLKLTANNPEKESAEELLEVNYEGSPMEIGFNIGYLLDVLATIESETVEINFYGEESSCLIREPGNKLEAYVIMPMRL